MWPWIVSQKFVSSRAPVTVASPAHGRNHADAGIEQRNMKTHFTRRALLAFSAALGAAALLPSVGRAAPPARLVLSDEQWRRRLSPAAFAVLRRDGTEAPYSSQLLSEHRAGVFACAGCALPLFASRTKFESGTGWPSFYAPLSDGVTTRTDRSLGFERTEVRCARCDGHFGHVFDDGPRPTGLRYCMNGVALSFRPARA